MGCKSFFQKIIGFFIVLLVGIGIIAQKPTQPIAQEITKIATTAPVPSATLTESPVPERTPIPTEAQLNPAGSITEMINSPTPPFSQPEAGSVCPYDPIIAALFDAFQQEDWLHWIEILSGEKPAIIDGKTYTIQTRWSESMFDGDPDAKAYDFVLFQLEQWGFIYGETLFEMDYTPFLTADSPTWKNIIVVIPGTDPDLADEEVLLTAHLDSTTYDSPEERAPGADDNGSGVATLLEAAKILREHSFNRTIKIIFFTGEEIGLKGSTAYVAYNQDSLENAVGVVNLDMFGYDADNDHCFEMHVGELAASNVIGGCMADVIEAYDLGIKFDYLVDEAREYSDHAPFWDAGIGAIEVLENFDTHNYPDGCGESDKNPYYHTEGDLVDEINVETAHQIAMAAIATVAQLAEMVE